MKTDTDVLDIYRRVFDDLPEADAVASVIATLRGVAAAADVDTAIAILKADDFCGDDAQLRQDAEAIREAFAQVSDAERVRDAYRAALVEIARHVASPGAEDLADKLDVEDLPTLVECVTAEYGNGHAAGDRARFERCKHDIARVLGLDEWRLPEWGEIVERVRARAAGLPPAASAVKEAK